MEILLSFPPKEFKLGLKSLKLSGPSLSRRKKLGTSGGAFGFVPTVIFLSSNNNISRNLHLLFPQSCTLAGGAMGWTGLVPLSGLKEALPKANKQTNKTHRYWINLISLVEGTRNVLTVRSFFLQRYKSSSWVYIKNAEVNWNPFWRALKDFSRAKKLWRAAWTDTKGKKKRQVSEKFTVKL